MSTKTVPFLVGLIVLAAACSDQDASGPRTIRAERTWTPVGKFAPPGLSTAERFGYTRNLPQATEEDAGGLTWNLPDGWTELPTSSMRQANFLVLGDERAECYLTVLSGEGGGLLANVNRWRKQMGLEPTDEQTLASAPRATLLGEPALLVDLEGTWSGMSGDAASDGYRLVGLLAVGGGQARFLKMIGPAERIADQKLAFLALAASFREGAAAHDHGTGEADPHAGVDMSGAGISGFGAPSGSAEGLSWTTPAGWHETDPRPMRAVTFEIGADPKAECYVVQLGGTAGGAFANINRWRGQMGQSALSDAEFQSLERISMLGTQAVVVEVLGTYTGMGDDLVEQASLLGAVCQLPQAAIFVKLIGPRELVDSSRQDFITFCQSLGQGG